MDVTWPGPTHTAAAGDAPQGTRVPESVSVVIPARNAAAFLGEQLAALAEQDGGIDFEVVVADNGSTDGTGEVIRSFQRRLPGLRAVDADAQRSAAYARNQGTLASTGELVLYCDADDVVERTWVRTMVDAWRWADCLGGRLDDHTLNSSAVQAWRPPFTEDALPLAFGVQPYPVGSNCGISRAVFDLIGGYDEEFSGSGQEVDFFWRAALAGYPPLYVHDAVVHYRHRSGLRALARQYFHYGKSNVHLYKRYRDRLPPRSRVAVAGQLLSEVGYAATAWGSKARLGNAVRRVAYLSGQVAGSRQHNVWRIGFDG